MYQNDDKVRVTFAASGAGKTTYAKEHADTTVDGDTFVYRGLAMPHKWWAKDADPVIKKGINASSVAALQRYDGDKIVLWSPPDLLLDAPPANLVVTVALVDPDAVATQSARRSELKGSAQPTFDVESATRARDRLAAAATKHGWPTATSIADAVALHSPPDEAKSLIPSSTAGAEPMIEAAAPAVPSSATASEAYAWGKGGERDD
jgi:hypothetical protein